MNIKEDKLAAEEDKEANKEHFKGRKKDKKRKPTSRKRKLRRLLAFTSHINSCLKNMVLDF